MIIYRKKDPVGVQVPLNIDTVNSPGSIESVPGLNNEPLWVRGSRIFSQSIQAVPTFF